MYAENIKLSSWTKAGLFRHTYSTIIFVTLYEKAEENRIVREAREEAERKRVEEARCREENRQRSLVIKT